MGTFIFLPSKPSNAILKYGLAFPLSLSVSLPHTCALFFPSLHQLQNNYAKIFKPKLQSRSDCNSRKKTPIAKFRQLGKLQ